MPVRGPRRLYLISQILVNNNDDPDDIDTQAGNTTRPILEALPRLK
jgi:hypothetical protein